MRNKKQEPAPVDPAVSGPAKPEPQGAVASAAGTVRRRMVPGVVYGVTLTREEVAVIYQAVSGLQVRAYTPESLVVIANLFRKLDGAIKAAEDNKGLKRD